MCRPVMGMRKNDLETFLNSKVLADNENLQIPVYSIVRVHHPSDTKRGVA